MDDEAISGFAAITGASPQVARHYLSLTDGNMEQGIQLFFDSPELASAADNPPPVPHPSTRPSRPAARPDPAGVIQIDSDDDEEIEDDLDNDVDTPPRATASNAGHSGPAYEDDEAMARRMQEELYGGGAQAGGVDTDGVRAPIGRTTETLVGPGSNWGGPEDMHDAVLEQLRRRQAPRTGTFC